jgi:PAS domain S-box-containing protein
MAGKPTYEELEQRVKELENEELGDRLGVEEGGKWADKAIRETEAKFRAITHSAKDAIIMMDDEGHISYWNKAAENIFGYSTDEALRKELHMFLAPQKYRDPYRKGILTFKATGRGPVVGKTLELEAVRKDGTRFPIELSVSVIKIDGRWHATGIVRDISERKRAEEELQETRDYLEKLFNYANAPIIVWDPAFTITRFNHAFERLTGKSSDEVVGAPLDILFPDDRREEAMAHIRRTGEGERWEVVEIPIVRADGTVRIVLWNSANLYAEDGTTVIATIAQGQDITERKRAEKAVRESEAKFRAITHSAKDAIIMMDDEGNISYWNEAAKDIFGYSAREAIGAELHLFLAPQKYHDAYRRGIPKFKKTGHGPAVGKTLELEAVRKDGTKFPIELSVSAIKRDGKWHATGIIRDISQRKRAEDALRKAHDELERRVEERTAKLARTTEQLKLELAERKRVEESLRESEERLRSVAQTASDAIITIDSRGNIVFWNRAAEKIFDYSADEAMGQPVTVIMPERFRKDHRNGMERVVSTGHSDIIGTTVEMVGLGKSGREFPVELSVATWKTKGGVFFTGILRDITKRKRAEEEIKRLSRQLICVIEDERKRLARDLHDEFGRALTALHFGIEALHDSLPQELQGQKTRCHEAIELIEDLGDNIRNISSELRPDMLDHLGLIPTLEWYIEDFVKRINGLQIDFQTVGVKKRPDAEIEIVLYRILQEALNNIAKHAKAKHVSILLTCSHPKLIFTIKDDGVGFERTEGILPSGANKQGIGLIGMRERVGSLGGAIDIRSSRGQGTVIRVELPVSLRQTEVQSENFGSR